MLEADSRPTLSSPEESSVILSGRHTDDVGGVQQEERCRRRPARGTTSEESSEGDDAEPAYVGERDGHQKVDTLGDRIRHEPTLEQPDERHCMRD